MQKKSVIAIALCCVAASCQQLNGAAENANARQQRQPAESYMSKLFGAAQVATGAAYNLGGSVAYYAQGATRNVVEGTLRSAVRVKNAATMIPAERVAYAKVQEQLQEYKNLPTIILGQDNQEPDFVKSVESLDDEQAPIIGQDNQEPDVVKSVESLDDEQ